MSIRVGIIGGAGYIGSILTDTMLKQGFEVVVTDNFKYNNQAATYGFLGHPNYKLFWGDIRQPLEMANWADVVIPLAAIVGAPACERNPVEAVEVNQKAIAYLVKHCSPRQRIIFPNSNSGYGKQGELVCVEENPLTPISLYGRTKCEAEKAVLDHPNSLVFRLATVFGASPRMRFDLLVNNWVEKLVYESEITVYQPEYKRNFIHVRDVARAFAHAILHPGMKGVYNLGDDTANMTKLHLANLISSHLGFNKGHYPVKIGEGSDPDQRDYLVSNSKLARTGFNCYYNIDAGIDEVIDICNFTPSDMVAKMRNV